MTREEQRVTVMTVSPSGKRVPVATYTRIVAAIEGAWEASRQRRCPCEVWGLDEDGMIVELVTVTARLEAETP